MSNPYSDLPPEAFWRSAVAEKSALGISGLWKPKFPVRPAQRIVTAGSCFAQHIGQALAARGYGWLDAEPAPEHMTEADRARFNYGIFSFRTGNIYTARMLAQWTGWAFGTLPLPEEVWEKDGRFYDPFRPAIEPEGFASRAELDASREATLAAIRAAFETANLFVFTMGLTESWQNRETGLEYAMCPGTHAGTFDPERHIFHNHRSGEILREMKQVLQGLLKRNRKMKVLLTVSPVPLTATASGKHVLTATTYSKSVLRAVGGMLAEDMAAVDYFPSYEIITAPPYRGMFYAANQRSVVPEGVSHVMESFFADQEAAFGPAPARKAGKKAGKTPGARRKGVKASTAAIKCEEEVLDAFAR